MRIKAKISDEFEEWEEDFDVESMEVAEEQIERIIKDFNDYETKMYGEQVKVRKLVSILGKGELVHDWEKRTAFCDYYGKVVYECVHCGLIKKVSHSSVLRPGRMNCFPDRVCRLWNKQFASSKNLKEHKKSIMIISPLRKCCLEKNNFGFYIFFIWFSTKIYYTLYIKRGIR